MHDVAGSEALLEHAREVDELNRRIKDRDDFKTKRKGDVKTKAMIDFFMVMGVPLGTKCERRANDALSARFNGSCPDGSPRLSAERASTELQGHASYSHMRGAPVSYS